MLSYLVGCQLVEVNNKGFTIRIGNRGGCCKHYEFIDDPGDCCGYNEIEGKLLVETDPKRMPVITKVEQVVEDDQYADRQLCKITFFGEDKKLAEINTESGSGSGWQYGACVTVKCVETGEEEVLSEW